MQLNALKSPVNFLEYTIAQREEISREKKYLTHWI